MSTSHKGSLYSSIQYCRGIAALIVVVAHTIEHPLATEVNSLQITGRLGVEIFFVVSGFIISTVCGKSSFNAWQFFFRRFMRVAPLYWACTLLVALICLALPQVFKTTQFTIEHLLLSLAFIPHANPKDLSDYAPLLKLGWTLNYEMFFYLVMGCLFFVKRVQLRSLAITSIFVSLIAAGTFFEWGGPLASTYSSTMLIPFITGVWLATADQARIFQKYPAFVGITMLVLASVGIVALYQVPFETIDRGFNAALLIGVATLIVTGLLQLEVKRSLPNLPLLKLVGDSSYSLYLTHMFVVGAAWNGLVRFSIANDPIVRLLEYAGIIAITIAIAHTVYEKFERPLMKWSHHIANAKTPGLAPSKS